MTPPTRAVEILRAGGNAVDAAVAVGFALAVVLPQAGNLGGGGFMLIRPAHADLNGGQPTFLDYREKAPAAATADMYLDAERNVVPGRSTVGGLSIGVPGTVAGLTYAETHFGKLGLARVMAPAIRLAHEGYLPSDEELATFRESKCLPLCAESRRIFQRNGDFYKSGERILQPDLARTLERIAADPADFYHGQMARQLADGITKSGGLITAADLAAYECKARAPLVGHYRGFEVVTAPPPSSGGIVLLESLNILAGDDLAALGADRSPAQVHLITEAFRRAYMDRGDYLGDPDYTQMPLAQMGSADYARRVAQDHRSGQGIAVGHARASCRVHAAAARHPARAARIPANHAFFRGRCRGQRRGEHVHAQFSLRLGRHGARARVSAQRRDG